MKQDNTVTSDWEEIRGSQGQSRGVLLARAYEQKKFKALDGELTEAAVETAEIRIPADPELAEELGHALLDYYAENQSGGSPGQKPMHQQYADQEPPG